MPAVYATRADVEALWPVAAEIPTVPTDVLETWLTQTQDALDIAIFGERLQLAHAAYTMHFVACAVPDVLGGEQGPQTSLSAGPETISAGFAAPAEFDFSTTKYGRAYEQICLGITLPFVVG